MKAFSGRRSYQDVSTLMSALLCSFSSFSRQPARPAEAKALPASAMPGALPLASPPPVPHLSAGTDALAFPPWENQEILQRQALLFGELPFMITRATAVWHFFQHAFMSDFSRSYCKGKIH